MQDAFRRFSETISAYGGTAHELRGDALVAEFDRASDSVSSVLAFQADNAVINSVVVDEIKLILRIGISLGEVIIADATLTGAGVVLAQRLEQLAEPGGVVVQGAAQETIPRRLPFEYEFLGEQQLKGFDELVRAYRVRLALNSAVPAPQPRTEGAPAATSRAPLQSTESSIAVLPFENMSGDPEQEYFSDRISGDIITTLSRIRQLVVIARNTTFTYKSQAVNVKAVAQELGVRYVLEGSVRKAGNRVRITARLIDGSTGNHLWAEKYDRELEDIFAVKDVITLTVVASIESELDRAEQERALRMNPESMDAWDFLRQGHWHLYKFNAESLKNADECLKRTLELDPQFGRAFTAMATSNLISYLLGFSRDPEERLGAAFDLSKKAIETDDKDALAQSILGIVLLFRGEHSTVAEALKKALSINPSFARAHHWLGFVYAFDHRETDAISQQDIAMRLSPNDPFLWRFMNVKAYAYFNLGQYEKACDWARRATSQKNAAFTSQLTLAASQAQIGRIGAAQKTVTKLLQLAPGFTISRMKTILPFKSDEVVDLWVGGLRKAGLPES
ncbi:MAG: adenylate/guanylate cyclase domain-containing protein [Gammaproteobacteria bacterium]|nr:adenylate/guanylate cyclase domain-containing protein [Gammaproteobacteria bacterium]MDH3466291.1 adenylate/guanylate cyclase domain-containing protein [Gammaproteobacteria bacterium]